ncbi:MAG: cytidylate kinase-like family protein [Clostridium fessum]
MIISVSRQFGSGGHKIAEALAEHFELPIYDHRMLDSIAKEKGVDPRVLEKYDEKPLNRFLARNVSGFSSSLENNLAQMQFSYLKDKADSGESFVVVGRCAETVLKEYDGLITIFVLGDEETRVKRIEQLHGLSEDEAKRLVKTKDWRRKSYHNCYSRADAGGFRNYDLSINSSRLGIEERRRCWRSMCRRGWTRCRNKIIEISKEKRKGNVCIGGARPLFLPRCYTVTVPGEALLEAKVP